MGLGRFENGAFDLTVSIMYEAKDPALELARWKEAFAYASKQLWVATAGQMQFGPIRFAEKGAATLEADAFVFGDEGSSSSGLNILGHPGAHMNLSKRALTRPLIIVHEFAHYAFGLGDEYRSGRATDCDRCTGDPDTGACIMENTRKSDQLVFEDGSAEPEVISGKVKYFCDPTTHTKTNGQERRHHESCWETIVRRFPALTIPHRLGSDPSATEEHQPVEAQEVQLRQFAHIDVGLEQHFVAILDKSPDREPFGSILGFREGAQLVHELLASTSSKLTVIQNNRHRELRYRNWSSKLPNSLQLEQEYWRPYTECAGTLVALERALQEFEEMDGSRRNQDEKTSTRVLFLFSDEISEQHRRLDDLISQLRSNRVRVFCAAFGDHRAFPNLKRLAFETGGRFEILRDDIRHANIQENVCNFLVESLAESAEDLGLVTMQSGVAEEQPPAWIPFPPHRAPQDTFELDAYIEQGSKFAAFIMCSNSGHELDFDVRQPVDSCKVDLACASSDGFKIYHTSNPSPGRWRLRVSSGRATNPAHFTVFALSQNDSIHTGVQDVYQDYPAGISFEVFARAHFYQIETAEPEMIDDAHSSEITLTTRTMHQSEPSLSTRAWEPLAAMHSPEGNPFRLRAQQVFKGEFKFDHPGSYDVLLEFINRVSPEGGNMRTRRVQLHIH